MTISDLVLACIPKSRYIGETELLEKYERVCKRHNVLPLWGQVKTALRKLVTSGQVIVDKTKGAKKL